MDEDDDEEEAISGFHMNKSIKVPDEIVRKGTKANDDLADTSFIENFIHQCQEGKRDDHVGGGHDFIFGGNSSTKNRASGRGVNIAPGDVSRRARVATS